MHFKPETYLTGLRWLNFGSRFGCDDEAEPPVQVLRDARLRRQLFCNLANTNLIP